MRGEPREKDESKGIFYEGLEEFAREKMPHNSVLQSRLDKFLQDHLGRTRQFSGYLFHSDPPTFRVNELMWGPEWISLQYWTALEKLPEGWALCASRPRRSV